MRQLDATFGMRAEGPLLTEAGALRGRVRAALEQVERGARVGF
jgi:hypothetical protein